MKHIIVFAALLLYSSLGFTQTINTVKAQKAKSEKEIKLLNKLLSETKNNQLSAIGRLELLQTKMRSNRSYMNSLNNEVKLYENRIDRNSGSIRKFEDEKTAILSLYDVSVYNGWRNKGMRNPLLFLLSSDDFNQAYLRFKHLKQTHNYSVKQILYLERLNDSLVSKNNELSTLVREKNEVVLSINKQRKEYEKDEISEKNTITQLKGKESEIKKKLNAEMRQRKLLTDKLNKLIESQIKKSGGKDGKYRLTPEEKIVSTDFAKNRGRLPWPVIEGIISEKFGIKKHPLYPRVEIINSGINITTPRLSEVRSVFNGIVSEIYFTPEMSNVVVVRHGRYMSVYANLSDVYVKRGDKISTKGTIGKIANDVDKGSVLNFQIWEDLNKLNPELWLVK